ncbi:hypothetical protein Cgig2_026769 [Carnegiea gigantea]|uniref:non-specific serine/threonine protein kinase n=1 Tax=Carnegiea gigantea TaxID=171969 RepID=A0A9Q1GP37_9CARY|nr:hypothetical protein Cgig2_026769 [Carnegiea gigantea]
MASLPLGPHPSYNPPPIDPSSISSATTTASAVAAAANRRPDHPMSEDKEMSPAVIQGNDQVTGHIISTTIGGKNGEPKRARCLETGETVAIKKVLQDRRYKNRELQLMRLFDHPNVISLKHCFFSTTSKDELFLNLVMEYVPESLYRVLKHYSSMNQRMPLIYVKLYTYQIFRGLAYIHTVPRVCHRDIKPQNLLVDPLTHQLKICDFGSAKVLNPFNIFMDFWTKKVVLMVYLESTSCCHSGANLTSYICSRYYRAPELIFGATEYTTSIDIWSAGCVLAELLLGQPLFPGENAVDQLVEIIKVLGTPTREEIRCMNPNYTLILGSRRLKLTPGIRGLLMQVFHKRMPPEAIDLASRLLQYSPSLRCTSVSSDYPPYSVRESHALLEELLVHHIVILPSFTEKLMCRSADFSLSLSFFPLLFQLEALAHPFFDELREPNARLPNGRPLPPLFNFKQELAGAQPELINRLIPEHVRRQMGFPLPG